MDVYDGWMWVRYTSRHSNDVSPTRHRGGVRPIRTCEVLVVFLHIYL